MARHARPDPGARLRRIVAGGLLAVAGGAGLVALLTDDPPPGVALPGSATGSPSPSSPGPAGCPSGSTPPGANPPGNVPPGANLPGAVSPGCGSGAAGIGAVDGRLYVDKYGAAFDALVSARTTESGYIRKIAEQPTAVWFADSSEAGIQRARSLAGAAAQAGKLPVLVLYNIPHRDCAGQSAGGAGTADEYREWIDRMAAALRGRRALVVLEPDAVPQAVDGCLDAAQQKERSFLLRYAITALTSGNARKKMPSTAATGESIEEGGPTVYLDAGNPTWIKDVGELGAALREAGGAAAHGFSLNVANFETTPTNVEYGRRVSAELGGKPFVIDTSRNGSGPAAHGPAGNEHWCNPRGRRLGDLPTVGTGVPSVDAYLWVKRPGESDGACGDGAPPAGRWWPEYALELAR
jgi:endoglucanase